MRARIALADGLVLEGRALGRPGWAGGEVVFTTAMTGYQEVLSDPSYRGQIVTMAYPLIGNYGMSGEAWESGRPHLEGLIVGEAAARPNHWRSESPLASVLIQRKVAGIAGVDTRCLVRHLRTHGLQRGVVSTEELSDAALVARARSLPEIGTLDLVAQVSIPSVEHTAGSGPRVAILDCGVKWGITESLRMRGCDLWVLPHRTTAEEILAFRPAGLVLSPGPGDPQRLDHQVAQVRRLWGRLPMFGICLGHQIIGRAAGAETFKLPYGHRGSNQPVRDLMRGRVCVTTQNHGYAVDDASLDRSEVVVTHRNLNDGTVEGLRHRRLPIMSVQYHPEGRPGPLDSDYLFDEWMTLLDAPARPAAVPSGSPLDAAR
ncbi:MAG TPA: glutamine-hydrolyzing carbamoyl-phosphate synthase small subunit [bacterium]|nr:glutamine-hydrolyzing carbamoyl-phosphate synthase small subunit [bacterium]